jgi:RES domain-containing protein
MPALYTTLDPKTSWMEAQQGMPFKAQPLTLVVYRVDCERVVDLTDPFVLSAVGIADEILSCPWGDLATRGLTPPTWELAETLIHAGHHGVLVPSFAPGTGKADLNLVLWCWSDGAPFRVEVIDDFSRLPKDDASWR